MKIISDQSVEKLKKMSANYLCELLSDSKLKNTPTLLLFSGGSAFEIIKEIKKDCVGNYLTVGMLDERFETDPKMNNFLQFKATEFYRLANEIGCEFIESIPGNEKSVEDFAEKIEEKWKNWRTRNSNGKIFITQGVGADGHTAGIVPYAENKNFFKKIFENDSIIVAGYDAGSKNRYPKRATATLSFLKNEVAVSLVWIVGKDKIKPFNDIMSDKGDLAETPARIIREMKDAIIFTDIKNNQYGEQNGK